jgi:acetyl-CoA carboxylase biotin carboxyl carrier protein
MDIKQIQELVKMINKTNISEISVEEKDLKITIKQKEDAVQTFVTSAPAPVYTQAAPAQIAPPAAQAVATAPPVTPKTDNLITIKSPMIGTFYRRTGPDKPAFVEVGTEVTPGKVLCIIEAMKLFNEIECEIKGKIVKVLIDDASPVEYDQPLFLVEP